MSYCYLSGDKGTIYFGGDITLAIASKFRRMLHRANNSVTIEINSNGGDLESCFMMVDTIEEAKACGRKVTTVATGITWSAAVPVFLAGTERKMLNHSTIMIHQAKFGFKARANELDNEYNISKRVQNNYWKMLDKYTAKESGYWKTACGDSNMYLTIAEATEEGMLT